MIGAKIKIFPKLIIIGLITVFSGCQTSKFTVTGKPGTEIYLNGDKNPIATIPESGRTKIEFENRYHNYFFIAKDPDSNENIPFMSDIKKNKRTLGWILTCIYPITLFSPLFYGLDNAEINSYYSYINASDNCDLKLKPCSIPIVAIPETATGLPEVSKQPIPVANEEDEW